MGLKILPFHVNLRGPWRRAQGGRGDEGSDEGGDEGGDGGGELLVIEVGMDVVKGVMMEGSW